MKPLKLGHGGFAATDSIVILAGIGKAAVSILVDVDTPDENYVAPSDWENSVSEASEGCVAAEARTGGARKVPSAGEAGRCIGYVAAMTSIPGPQPLLAGQGPKPVF